MKQSSSKYLFTGNTSNTNTAKPSKKLYILFCVIALLLIFIIFVIPFGTSSSGPWNSSYFHEEHNTPHQVVVVTHQSVHRDKNNPVPPLQVNNHQQSPSSTSTSSFPTTTSNNKNLKNKKFSSSSSTLTLAPPKDDLDFIPNVKKRIDIDRFVKESGRTLLDARHEAILRNMYDLWSRSFDQEELVTKKRVVPGMIIPTFKDGDHLQRLLLAFDTPVRHITFINNGPGKNGDPIVRKIMDVLQPLQDVGAISAYWHPENAGFSTSINIGLRRVRRSLTESANYHPDSWNFKTNPIWYFIVNCDSLFSPFSAQIFAQLTNEELTLSDGQRLLEFREKNPGNEMKPKKSGLFYTNDAVDHFCFAISEEAVSKAGDMDECFFPAYMEDVDWRWRVHLAGFDDFFTGVQVGHHRSVNLKKASPQSAYMQMLGRTSRGWEYGRMKWGNIGPGKLKSPIPPTGRVTPFGIKGAPVNLYVIDPVHRHCVLTGEGPRFLNSQACWYNGSVLLPFLPPGTELPKFLKEPVKSMDQFYRSDAPRPRPRPRQ